MVRKNIKSGFIFSYQGDGFLRLMWGNLENGKDAKLLLKIKEDELMNLEKERLGFSRNELVFIGMANLSKYYWCAWQYFLKAKREEVNFFDSYFVDRLKYSEKLGLIKKPPTKLKDILKIGDKIKYSDVRKLLNKRIKEFEPPDKDDTPIENSEEIDPLQKGRIYEMQKAEKYPTIRWNFLYKNIVLVGVPDGITKDFVYEFKYTAKSKYMKQTLITSACQADIYGMYFERPRRRVQIFCEEENKLHTYVDIINKQKVIDLLEKWIDMKKGKLPLKPQPWKCTNCEFKENCVLLKQ